MYKTEEKKNTRAKNINNLSVSSRRPYFVKSLREFLICPPMLRNSSCVSDTVFDDDTVIINETVKNNTTNMTYEKLKYRYHEQ